MVYAYFLTTMKNNNVLQSTLFQAKNSRGVIGFIPENYIVYVDENAVDNTQAPENLSMEEDPRNSVDDADVAMVTSPVVSSPPPVEIPPAAPMVTVTDDQEDFPLPPPPITPPSDNTQEVTSYSSGDAEVQQVTNSMDNMTLPVGGKGFISLIFME